MATTETKEPRYQMTMWDVVKSLLYDVESVYVYFHNFNAFEMIPLDTMRNVAILQNNDIQLTYGENNYYVKDCEAARFFIERYKNWIKVVNGK